MKERFRRFASTASMVTGSWPAFMLAVVIVVVWFLAGFWVGFTNTFYQLLINTGTTIITFLMVFLIQNTQNRDAKALHLKLDELIKATRGASNTMIDLDKLSDEQLKELEAEYKRICDIEDEMRNNGEQHPLDKVLEKTKQSAEEGAKEGVQEGLKEAVNK